EKDYPPAVFDAVLSVDTFYFVKDKEAFLRQIYGWLKPGGVLAVMYSPFRLFGDSIGSGKTGFAAAASNAGYAWEATEYTDSFYRLMRRKHMTAVELEPVFRREGLDWLYDRLVTESISPGLRFSKFKRNYARYMYIIEKGGSA
ncbi:MAG: class I SAM-dependent methyltransferase, partial [Desulfovibrionaceae bacterium]|nr:class I SAM-dependent methyltransferase [Desulfovibrionaceae bacterium]